MTNELVRFTQQDIKDLEYQAIILGKSGLLPSSLRSTEAIVTVAIKGAELGIPPMQALTHIHVIQGKPTISAELMRALVARAGHRIWVDPSTDDKVATLYGQRWEPLLGAYSDNVVSVSFSMDDANRAGLTGKDNWKKYPRAMLVARATSILCREHFADVMMGASYTPEELDPDIDLSVSDDGAVEYVRVEREEPAPEPEPVEAEVVPDQSRNKKYAAFHALLNEAEVEEQVYRAAIWQGYGVDSVKDLDDEDLDKVIRFIRSPEGLDRFVASGIKALPDYEEREL